MRKVVLFIAMSLDGYIADRNGNVHWLHGEDENNDNNDSYSQFIKNIDTVVMGWKTYQQITTELSPDVWVYPDFMSYVITHRECVSRDNIQFTHENPCQLIEKLKNEAGKDIWICGGATLVQQFMKNDLIDQYYISIIPTVLGDGIPLFQTLEKEIPLKLICTQNDNGIVDLIYERR